MAKNKDKVGVRGFFRVQITDGGDVVGDSGWRENQVTNLGIEQYIINWVVGNTSSGKSVTHMGLGTGSAPASDGTVLPGEISHNTNSRGTVTTSILANRTAQFTAAFNSQSAASNNWLTTTATINNVGLFNTGMATNSATQGTILAGNTFAASGVATNQNVQVTYQLRFS